MYHGFWGTQERHHDIYVEPPCFVIKSLLIVGSISFVLLCNREQKRLSPFG